MKKIRILSVDGGGIRGVLPGTILAQLEKILQQLDNSNRKLGDYFDMIAGTSTGGILACLYLIPGEDGKAKYSAKDAVDLYINNGEAIFDRTTAHKLLSVGGVLHQKYSQDALYNLLTEYMGDTTLNQLIKPCLITSYEMSDRQAMFFNSADARYDEMYNFYVRDVARATSAAPTYFSPAHIESRIGQKYSLVDGGMFANNPALCAYAEARKTIFSKELNDPQKKDKPTAADMIIVSLGTGSVKKKYKYDDFKSAGEIRWLEPVIDILMSGNSETVAYQLTQMYLTLDAIDKDNYYRLEPGLRDACSEMDEATKDNIDNLYQAGLLYANTNHDMLEGIAKKLIENE